MACSPLRRSHTRSRVNANTFGPRQYFIWDVPQTVRGIGPGITASDHRRPNVLTVDPTDGDGPPMSVGSYLLAARRADRQEVGKSMTGGHPGLPAVDTALLGLWSVDTVQSDRFTAQLERITINNSSS